MPRTGDKPMKFGVSQAFSPAKSSLEILRAAEDAGFDQFWLFDSHVIWQESYSLFGWLIGNSRNDKMEFGTCVTNPVTRDPTVTASGFATLNQITGGRMICGIGRGDSSVRVMKRKPANLAALEDAIEIIRTVGSGQPLKIDDVDVHMDWAEGRIPIYVAGYGPKALRLAGRVGDGVIFQVADPFFIEWGMQFVREGAEEAGRNPDDIVVHCAAATCISDDKAEATDLVRWFPALVANHIVDALRYHPPDVMPDYVTEYVESRPKYDYYEHAQAGAEHGKYVPDEICERFCVIGSVEECAAKVRELVSIGVSEFNIYPSVPDLAGVIATYGSEIAPQVRTPRVTEEGRA
jgi:probable F420-dependent oxidoreductase